MKPTMHEAPCRPGINHSWLDGEHIISTREEFSTFGRNGGTGKKIYPRHYTEHYCAHCGLVAFFPAGAYPENCTESNIRKNVRFERIVEAVILERHERPQHKIQPRPESLVLRRLKDVLRAEIDGYYDKDGAAV